MAVLQFFLFVSKLSIIKFDRWQSPIAVLNINDGNYAPMLTTTDKYYQMPKELTPSIDFTLEHGTYFRFSICRDFVIALYNIATKALLK